MATAFAICFLYFRLMIYLHFCKNKSEVQLIIDLFDDIISDRKKSVTLTLEWKQILGLIVNSQEGLYIAQTHLTHSSVYNLMWNVSCGRECSGDTWECPWCPLYESQLVLYSTAAVIDPHLEDQVNLCMDYALRHKWKPSEGKKKERTERR